ncbi:hypothetical protein DPMN_050999 [Dreissena polymorpha]|uniref:Uncharacterized protein n=1 Tax=Dreissena polymorpha TaxID=45954 RepID=A0A9D4CH50_DREPO|nr:hypothetical protein DPMN_050999 [Dreissena polymorpha]
MVCRAKVINFRPGDSKPPLHFLICQVSLASRYSTALCPPIHFSSLFRHSHKEADSVSRVPTDMTLFRTFPVTPSLLKVRHSDCAGKPLQPTSTGKHHAFQPSSVQVSVRAWYFSRFFSKLSSIRSSHGTVSSTITTCFDAADHSTMSGLWFVMVISCGNLSRFSKSASIHQSVAVPIIPHARLAFAPSPALTKEMNKGLLLVVFCAFCA